MERPLYLKTASEHIISVDDLFWGGEDLIGRGERDRALVIAVVVGGLVFALVSPLPVLAPGLRLRSREGDGGEESRDDDCCGGLHVD